MSKEYKNADDEFTCPHCEEAMEGPVGDYVIAGRSGFESTEEEQCVHCDGWFDVMKTKNGTYIVDGLDDPEECGRGREIPRRLIFRWWMPPKE